MAYLDTINEKIVYKAKVHWVIYLSGVVFVLFAIIAFVAGSSNFGALFLLIALILFIRAAIYVWSTELTISEKSIIAKWGLICRETIEMRLNKVESVRVNQSILGRILNYGDIIIVGSGASASPIKFIEEPMRFRKELEYLLERQK